MAEFHYHRQTSHATLSDRHPTALLDTGDTQSDAQCSANFLYAVPYFSGLGGTVGALEARVRTGPASGTSLHLGIYAPASFGDFRPQTLLIDAGSISCASASLKSLPASYALTRDSIFLLVFQTDNRSMHMHVGDIGGGGQQCPLWGINPNSWMDGYCYMVASWAYGPLPATFPYSAAQFGTVLGNLAAPIISVRYLGYP